MGTLSDWFSSTKGESPSSDGGPGETSSDGTSLRSELGKARRRLTKAERESAEQELSKELDKLYAPENFEALATFWPDVRYVQTGDDVFIPTDRERAVNTVSMSAVFRVLIKLDPGWLALALLASNQAKMISRMEMQYKKKNPKGQRGRQQSTPAQV